MALTWQFGGVAALWDVMASEVVRMLGPSTVDPGAAEGARVESLEISGDGQVLLAGTSHWSPFAFRVAPRFEDSTLLSSMKGWLATLSADGRFAASAGDQRIFYAAKNGAFLWSPEVFDLDVAKIRCWGTRLRPSPAGRWAAGAGYEGKIDVFAGAVGATAPAWPRPLVSLPAGCFDTVAFTRDEALMATSEPALYRTGPTPADWQRIWRLDGSSLGNGGFDGKNDATNDVTFSPDETRLLVSRCSDDVCDVRLYDAVEGAPPVTLPALTKPHPSFSPGGEWIVDGGLLWHVASGEVRPLDAAADVSVAVFAPNADVIAGGPGGVITRYCRTP
jgi:hypothetical protein